MASTVPIHARQPSGCTSAGPISSFCGTSKLLYSRPRLKQIALQTMQIAEYGAYLNSAGKVVNVGESLELAKRNSIHYHHSHIFPERPPRQEQQQNKSCTKFQVSVCSSLEASLSLRGDGRHVGVLNSASGKLPGGRFREGTISQEDTICRASLLYPCLAQFEHRQDHFYRINNELPKGISTSCAIFSPRVPVVRHDTVEASVLDEPHEVSFVTIPAPNAFIISKQQQSDRIDRPKDEQRAITDRALREAVRDRIFRALSIFAEQGCTDLVLSAFGCGVHGNDPTLVATIFRELLQEDFAGQFDSVLFAIHPSRYGNYKPFVSVFMD